MQRHGMDAAPHESRLSPVDNQPNDLTPDPETLVVLYELRDRYGLAYASRLPPRSEADRHRLEHGHALRFGCCGESAARRHRNAA